MPKNEEDLANGAAAADATASDSDPEKGSSCGVGVCRSTSKSCSMFWRHVRALEIKRFHHSKRNKKGILCEVRPFHVL